jgi:hypothetical protein
MHQSFDEPPPDPCAAILRHIHAIVDALPTMDRDAEAALDRRLNAARPVGRGRPIPRAKR